MVVSAVQCAKAALPTEARRFRFPRTTCIDEQCAKARSPRDASELGRSTEASDEQPSNAPALIVRAPVTWERSSEVRLWQPENACGSIEASRAFDTVLTLLRPAGRLEDGSVWDTAGRRLESLSGRPSSAESDTKADAPTVLRLAGA